MTNHHIDAQTRQNLQTALRALTEAEAGPDAATLFASPILTLWQPILLHHNLCCGFRENRTAISLSPGQPFQ